LSDETIRQHKSDGKTFVEVLVKSGIIPGIKVDKSAKDMAGFPGEKITEGLDGLRERLKEYHNLGARFAKWRAVIKIGDGIPTRGCIESNAYLLARYAALCQEADIVPMVEPEVLMDGTHTIERCSSVTEEVHRSLFLQLYEQRVNLQGIILKPNMILPGKDCPVQVDDETIASATIDCFRRSVPAAVPGIAFLSGGQPSLKATSRLNAMHSKSRPPLPWALTFSFSRAIEYPAIEIWSGNKNNIEATQKALYHRACCDNAARHGEYNVAMEKESKK
jgi:fructose-bisphosphate aldolase class I